MTATFGRAIGLRARGWDPLPLPPSAKWPPPEGFTGHAGREVTDHDLATWATQGLFGDDANLAVRLPDTVIGLDVDAYGEKPGAATLARLEAELGKLPDTVRVTSRYPSDDVSGIRLFRVPADHGWALPAGSTGIDLISRGHRYVVAPGSRHPQGLLYMALNEKTGEVHPDDLPCAPHDLPTLPTAWESAMRRKAPELLHSTPQPFPDEWDHDGEACAQIKEAADTFLERLRGGDTGRHGSRHDLMVGAVMRLASLAARGHPGGRSALSMMGPAYVEAIGADRQDVPREYRAAVESAVGKLRAAPELRQWCSGGSCAPGVVRPLPDDLVALATSAASSAHPTTVGDEPSSWAPADLATVLAGEREGTAVPGVMLRADGHGLLYPGKVHSFHGEPESGKSWAALVAAREQLLHGERVLFLDFESDPATVVGRLRLLGVSDDVIRSGLDYVHPEAKPMRAEFAALLGSTYALAVLDGVTEALAIFGAESNDNDAVTTFMREVPRAIARATGAAVVLVDHVTKSTEGRGRFPIGAQAKTAAIDGASYSVEPSQHLAPGARGILTLRVGKDRPGQVRARAGAYRVSDRTQVAATLVLDATGTGITCELRAVAHEPAAPDGGWRPTGYMQKVSDVLELATEPLSMKRVEQAVPGRSSFVRRALEVLVEERYAARTAGPRGSLLHSSVRAYREALDPVLQERDEVEGLQRSIRGASPTSSSSQVETWDEGRGQIGGNDHVPGRGGDEVGRGGTRSPETTCNLCRMPLSEADNLAAANICSDCLRDGRASA